MPQQPSSPGAATPEEVLHVVTQLMHGSEKQSDQLKAADMLAKHHGLLNPREESGFDPELIREIEEGIEDTGIRAGVIGEVGVSEKIYPVERRSLLAAAKAHCKTGLPIYLHTYPWSWAGLEAVELLMEDGVAPKNICVCHIDVTFDIEYLHRLLDLGVYIEFDNFGKEFYFEAQDGAFAGGPFATDVERVRMLRTLAEEGYGPQILIANDVCLKASLHKYGGWGYDHIFENIVPMMRQEKLPGDVITQIVDTNPIRFLMQE